MKTFNLIFLRNAKVLLSLKQYSDWKEIQDEYDTYVASVDFEILLDVQDYIKMDYKLSHDKAKSEIGKLENALNDTVNIEV